MENEKEKEEKNKQILSNALKALRECKDIGELSNDHTGALYNASADDLYRAYLDIDTYFNADKCFSFENPCCAYGLCCAGTLATAALCGTVWPRICNTISPTPSDMIPYGTRSVPAGDYPSGEGAGVLVNMGIITTMAPVAIGVLALCEHKHRAKKKNKIKQIADDNGQHNDGEQKNVFLKKLKEIISFHSYYDTERDNIKNAIRQLCDSKQNYNKELQEANNNNATIDNKQVKDNNGINKA